MKVLGLVTRAHKNTLWWCVRVYKAHQKKNGDYIWRTGSEFPLIRLEAIGNMFEVQNHHRKHLTTLEPSERLIAMAKREADAMGLRFRLGIKNNVPLDPLETLLVDE